MLALSWRMSTMAPPTVSRSRCYPLRDMLRPSVLQSRVGGIGLETTSLTEGGVSAVTSGQQLPSTVSSPSSPGLCVCWLLLMLWFRKRIRLAIAVTKEAARAVNDMKVSQTKQAHVGKSLTTEYLKFVKNKNMLRHPRTRKPLRKMRPIPITVPPKAKLRTFLK